MNQTATDDPLAGYIEDKALAKKRGISERTQRLERQRGDGPPYVKLPGGIYYPVDGFREWLRSRMQFPKGAH